MMCFFRVVGRRPPMPTPGYAISAPAGIYYDSIGNYLYIANSNGNTISRWTPEASTGTIIIGSGTGSSLLTDLNSPVSVTMDSFGNLYVADHDNERIMFYGSGTYNNSRTSGTQILSLTYQPIGIAFDSSMNLYTADPADGQVWKYAKL